jgi:hypothetical protein
MLNLACREFGVSASVPNMSLKAILKYSAADPDPENSGQGDTVFGKASINRLNKLTF